jgi:hypothetical protein
MKWLGIVLAVTVISTIVVNGQKKSSQPTANASAPNNVGNPAPPSPQVVCVVNQPNANQEGNWAENHPKGYLPRLVSPENLPAICLIFVGIGGIWVARRTLNHMRESSEIQARAYVVVERGIIANVVNPIHDRRDHIETVARIIDPQAGPHAQITIKNTGQTPAYKLVHWALMGVHEYPLTTKLPPMPEPEHPFWNVLGSSVPEVKTLRMPRPLTAEEIDGLRNGSKAIYCYGEIRYEDAFKKKRWVRYRCMYAAPHCGIIGIGTDLVYCEEGNDAN